MEKIVVYIHGKGGNAAESEHYAPLFANHDVVGFDYKAKTPYEAVAEFPIYFDTVCKNYKSVTIIANSIGAYYVMHTLAKKKIDRAFFISPVVNMEMLILTMMRRSNVTENELREKKEISTAFGETLSWKYLCYVREHPLTWEIPTDILYGKNDELVLYESILKFKNQIGATLTVMNNGEHWFHTKEQMNFLDTWIKKSMLCIEPFNNIRIG